MGDEVTYELHVRNRGTKNAEGVGIVAYFSEGIEPVSAEGGPHDVANGVVAFRPLASLAVGDEVVYKIRARAERTASRCSAPKWNAARSARSWSRPRRRTSMATKSAARLIVHEAIASRVPTPAYAQPPAQMPS